jgi:hypothetical protein
MDNRELWEPGSPLDDLIRHAGWRPGRAADISTWRKNCFDSGCQMGPEMTAVVTQLGWLTLPDRRDPNPISWTEPLMFEPHMDPSGRTWVEYMEPRIGAPFSVAGCWNPAFLLIDIHGNYFVEHEMGFLGFAGSSFVVAMECMLFGTRAIEPWPRI